MLENIRKRWTNQLLFISLMHYSMVFNCTACNRATNVGTKEREVCKCAQSEQSSLPYVCRSPEQDKYMKFVEETLQTQCDLVDPFGCPENRHDFENKDEVDFIVVGGGSAGSVVASRISEISTWNVALLEAGGREPTAAQVPAEYLNYPTENSPINWNFEMEPQENACLSLSGGRCRYPRGKVIGGTSVIHGMMYVRGNSWDYDQWLLLGVKGWNFSEVLPYFLKSEDNNEIGTVAEPAYHRTSGYLTVQRFPYQPALTTPIMAAAKEMGFRTNIDVNGIDQMGFTTAQATVRNGARLSLSKAFLHPILDRKNLRISLHSLVTRVLINPDAQTAVGVEYEKYGEKRVLYARKEVILCAGAIQSPQLLLLSGVGDKTHLTQFGIPVLKHLPFVGKNLQNHLSIDVSFKVEDEPYYDRLNNRSLQQYLKERNGPMSSTGMSQVTGFIHLNTSDSSIPKTVPNIQIFFSGYMANCSSGNTIPPRSSKTTHRYFNMVPTLLRPHSRGEIKLRCTDPKEPPYIYFNSFSHQGDMKLLLEGIRFVLNLSETEAMKSYGVKLNTVSVKGCENLVFNSDDYWECAIKHWTNPENHQVGTCSMGSTEDNSVLDNRLRVHGISHLRVIDASSIPVVPSGNLNAPVVMLAEKGADIIKEDHGQ